MRHLEGRTLWLQAKVKEKLVKVLKVSSEENVADIGTKVHTKERFTKLVSLDLSNNNIRAPGAAALGVCIQDISRTFVEGGKLSNYQKKDHDQGRAEGGG